jgi:hypothetical protein
MEKSTKRGRDVSAEKKVKEVKVKIEKGPGGGGGG